MWSPQSQIVAISKAIILDLNVNKDGKTKYNKIYILYIQYKQKNCSFSKLKFQFMMSSTCFEAEGSSSGRRLCIQF